MQHKVQEQRNILHNILKNRIFLPSKNQEKKRLISCDSPLNVVSFDHHEKLCGYQNGTYSMDEYRCLDTYLRKALFFYICYSNSNPMFIGRKIYIN